MTYSQVLDYLFGQLPFFQRIGPAAYKANLDNSLMLSEHFHHPERNIRHIHIAGTNGKGSTAHMVASILQEQGYKTGLATSPHLRDFRERIRINGKMIPKSYVRDFVQNNFGFLKQLQASFFEISIAMTFKYFSDEHVDVAVIETGLGGRLDSTNIIRPLISVITNIGYDHTNLLGDTLEQIAAEKAGIIKEEVPVVTGNRQKEVFYVFENAARKKNAQLFVASELFSILNESLTPYGGKVYRTITVQPEEGQVSDYLCDLLGDYQTKNMVTALAALFVLNQAGTLSISEDAIRRGLRYVSSNTGLAGRWQQIRKKPMVICDTAHNADGIALVVRQILAQKYDRLHMVIGMVNDKDTGKILPLFPREAAYYFCAPDIPRALPADTLAAEAEKFGLKGNAYSSVNEALLQAICNSKPSDMVFVGGSTFVVAEAI